MSHVLWSPSILSDGNMNYSQSYASSENCFSYCFLSQALSYFIPGLISIQRFEEISFSLSSSLLSSIFHKSWTLSLHWTLFFCLFISGTRLDYVWVLVALPMMQSQGLPFPFSWGSVFYWLLANVWKQLVYGVCPVLCLLL